MMTVPIFTAMLDADVLGLPKLPCFVWESLVLTPRERWQAVKKLGGNSYGFTADWLFLIGIIAIGVLTVSLFAITIYRALRDQKVARRLFIENAEKKGLSNHEREILMNVADSAGLKETESIFTMTNAFERGTTAMLEKSLSDGQSSERSEQIRNELLTLREKLGFLSLPASSIGIVGRTKRISSRQIPVGKKLHLTRRTAGAAGAIDATVIENDDIELTVRLHVRARVAFGDVWRVRYYFGASVWEFDTAMVSFDGDTLVLKHSDDVRFVNRRRFLRVPVRNLAFIARFPFTKVFAEDGRTDIVGGGTEQSPVQAGGIGWKPIEFVHALVTELAGPGLRIEAPLKVEAGERILVVLRLDEDDTSAAEPGGNGAAISKIIEDIAEVKHVEPAENGFSIAVELVGLRDADLNELVRATNIASLKADSVLKDVENSKSLENVAAQQTAAQGI